MKPSHSLGLCSLTLVLTSKGVNNSTLRDSDFAEEETSPAKAQILAQRNHLRDI